MIYGKELILDLHGCHAEWFTRGRIKRFLVDLCDQIGMKRCDLHFWDDVGVPPEEQQTEPHLKGTSAVQFILTSNITVHTLDILERVYLNVFSCADFDPSVVKRLAIQYFGGRIADETFIDRK